MVVKQTKLFFRSLLFSILILVSFGCSSYNYYFIENATETVKEIEVHYIKENPDNLEYKTPPDGLMVTYHSQLPNKPHKWYKETDQKRLYEKINDSTYLISIKKGEKIMIPYRFTNVNSIERIIINKKQEILFTDVKNDEMNTYEVINNKQETHVNYHSGLFIQYYLIEFSK